jgi:LysR family transcriptional regulator of abg operon
MKTRHIRAFRAIVDTGSIRAAARKIGVSQPALTKTLRELETLLGVPLLLRSVRGVTLTEFGRALMPRVTLIEEEILRAREEISQMLGQKGSTVAIGLSAVVSLLISAQAMTRLWKRHPLVNVRVIDGQFDYILHAIQQGRLDFAVGPLPQVPEGQRIIAEPLFHHRIVPVVRNGHPLAAATSLADLQKSDWLVPSADDAYPALVSQDFMDHGLSPPRIAVGCESFPSLIELVKNTDLVAAVPATLLQLPTIAEHMLAIPVREKTFFTTIALVRDSAVALTPVAEMLAREFRLLARQLAKRVGSDDIIAVPPMS